MIYHITTGEEWGKAKLSGFYTPPGFEKEGFIHSSTREQLLPTLNRRFKGVSGVVVLEVDTERVGVDIVYEDLSGKGEEHPHIYGKLSVDAVVSVYTPIVGDDGEYVGIEEVLSE